MGICKIIFLIIIIFNFNVLIACKEKYLKISHDLSTLNDVLIEIFHVCHPNYETLIISDDNNNHIDSKLLETLNSKMSVILFENLKKHQRKFFYTKKIDAFILFSEANKNHLNLKHVLKNFLNTSWKKTMPPFFIFHKLKNNCGIAEEILTAIWEFYAIAYFICNDKEKVLIYTYNPFTSRAPNSWKLRKIVEMRHPTRIWTLYVRKYKKGTICGQLDFDRTQFLDGYPVKIASYIKPHATKTQPRISRRTFDTRSFRRASYLYQSRTAGSYTRGIAFALNISVSLYFFENPPAESSSISTHVKKEFQNDTSIDLYTQRFSFSQKKIFGYDYTFPAYCHYLGILTCNRGYKTPVEKIQDFYGVLTLLSMIFFLVLTFVVIWWVENRRVYFAAFEVIRLLINASLYTRMDTLTLRIFFSMIFLYFLIIQATFSGNLANFLTKPELRRHPETLKDLKGLGYSRIYGGRSINYSMIDLVEDDGQQFIIETYCWKRIEKDNFAACISDYHTLFQLTFLKNVNDTSLYYLNKKPFGNQLSFYAIRRNWPLSDRINQAIMWIWQAGLREFWELRRSEIIVYRTKVSEAKSRFMFTPISLEQLTFAFIILGIGLTCATVTFIIELYVAQRQNRNVTVHKIHVYSIKK